MIAALLVFILVAGLIVGIYAAARAVPAAMAEQRVEERLREVGGVEALPDAAIVIKEATGPVPALDRLIGSLPSAAWLPRLVEQSGVRTSASGILVISVLLAVAAPMLALTATRHPVVTPVAALLGLVAPMLFLLRRRSMRIARFEEQFPDALDLMSRAIRAGHAFQTALGMVADESAAPVGAEFRKTFDQQNFGLPLREALDALATRVPLLDIRFFVTAVTIQRESGGNLSEILENLAHVVRERFKIRRQVRIHTAHGRFTGYVLLALPAALAVALSTTSPEQMQLLFREPMGQMMVGGAIVMQTIGFFWIRQVIKIEV
jgi:tight adherence protein B